MRDTFDDVPKDWRFTRDHHFDAVVIEKIDCSTHDATRPTIFVTVNFEQRVFRSGISFTGPVHSKKKYAGRGWRRALVRDSVKWLQKLCRNIRGASRVRRDIR